MKATLYLTYQKVGKNNLDSLLRDAQKLAYDHAVKAESIPEQPFVNKDKDVYGMFYMINGNAATQAEFYATDSLQHFVNGALYFDGLAKTKPLIVPAPFKSFISTLPTVTDCWVTFEPTCSICFLIKALIASPLKNMKAPPAINNKRAVNITNFFIVKISLIN